MYHIKNDKRSETSANALYRALIQMLQSTPLQDINITKLVERAMVGRSTFYRNFDEPLDILKWKCDSMFRDLVEEFKQKYHRGQVGQLTFIRSVFEYWEQRSELLEALIFNKRIDVIQNATTAMTDLLKKYDSAKQVDSTYYQYSINLRISIVVGMMTTWIERGKKESASEITAILLKNLKEIPQMPVIF